MFRYVAIIIAVMILLFVGFNHYKSDDPKTIATTKKVYEPIPDFMRGTGVVPSEETRQTF